jgi:hypothetical protein
MARQRLGVPIPQHLIRSALWRCRGLSVSARHVHHGV